MISNALYLREYIKTIDDFRVVEPGVCPYCDHIGALFTDAVLQAGLSYRSVVMPRVTHVLELFPEANTVKSFSRVLECHGISKVLNWQNDIKIRRMQDLVNFCLVHSINTTTDLVLFLKDKEGERALKSINGFGDKTCDYLKRLMGFDNVAVDRHIRAFLERADITYNDYSDIKEVVEYAADFMGMNRRTLDYSIWSYMSQQINIQQLAFDF
ncbi:MAG: hypothetical protein II825_01020 [Paludibacteraceae bacterium]|nr:hypothetical protein [Paludibacteraceae bacterium]